MKQFTITLLTALFAGAVAQAQNPAPQPAAGKIAKPAVEDVQIIIQSQQVRIATRSSIDHMQLQIFDQTGEAIFDSGLWTANEITWPLQLASGAPVKSGLYAYTLSIKEAGATDQRMRRGHFIVDRAADRSSGGDRLWVTSQGADAGGEGAELTVARDQNAVIAGTQSPSRTSAESGVEVQGERPMSAASVKPLAVAGTAGHIPKFTSQTDLGNSVMAEVNGAIGIGVTAPLYKLDVAGTMRSVRDSSTDIVAETTSLTDNSWAKMWMITTGVQRWSMGTSRNFNGNQLYFEDENNHQIRMGIQPNGGPITIPTGNVGIGITGNPSAKLQVNAPDTAGILSSSAGNAVIGYSSTPGYAAVFGQNTTGTGYGIYGKGTTGYAMYAEGNAGQSLDKGGFVKAMIVVNADGTIRRCYNGQTGSTVVPCGFTVDSPVTGRYIVDFGFRVYDRFWSLSSMSTDNGPDDEITGRVHVYGAFPSSIIVRCFFAGSGGGVVSDFSLIVY
jgi:hypothetical protein